MRSCLLILCGAVVLSAKGKPKETPLSPIDQYIQDAQRNAGPAAAESTPGSLWSPSARMTELPLDLRARRVDDIVTIIVEDRASAVAKGSVRSARNSSARASVDTLLGPRTSGWLPNLAGLSSDTKLDGEGETARENLLTTTLTARVTHVLPNGNLVVEGTKDVAVNAERQLITVRGVVRPYDLSPRNAVASNQLAQLEIKVNGKGVVGDAVRRPALLYRILLGVLPF